MTDATDAAEVADAGEATGGPDAARPGESAGRRERGFDELFVLPDPDSTRYLVVVISHGGTPHHVGTFDAAALDDGGDA